MIGLESADLDLLQLWLREGRLSFMNSLMRSGVWAWLLSTKGLFSDSPWSSCLVSGLATPGILWRVSIYTTFPFTLVYVDGGSPNRFMKKGQAS